MTEPSCAVDGCLRPVKAKGKCSNHYKQEWQRARTELCGVDGCPRTRATATMCGMHDSRMRRKGTPAERRLVRDFVDETLRTRDRSSGCWDDWPHAVNPPQQRPVMAWGTKVIGVSRYVRFAEDGDWPTFACHHCDNPKCWNPDHIYAGDPSTNMADQLARGRQRNGYLKRRLDSPQA